MAEHDTDDLRDLDEELASLDLDEPLPDIDELGAKDGDDAPEQASEPETDEPEPSAAKIDDTAQLRAEVEALKREQEAARYAEAQAAEQARQAQLEARESELKAKRREALEADDMDAYEKIDDELADVRYQRRAQHQPVAPESSAPQAPQAAVEWVNRNPRFNTDAAFKAAAMEINNQLINEGFNPDHPRFYQEIDKRLNRTPRMNGDNKQGAPVNRASTARTDTRSADRQDRSWMEKLGIPATDKRAQTLWAQSKRQVQQMARGGR